MIHFVLSELVAVVGRLIVWRDDPSTVPGVTTQSRGAHDRHARGVRPPIQVAEAVAVLVHEAHRQHTVPSGPTRDGVVFTMIERW